MRKSTSVPATFLASYAALILTGCSHPQDVRRCIDQSTGQILPESYCQQSYYGGGYRGGLYMPYGYRPMWGYGGSYYGGRMRGFMPSPRPGADIMSPRGTMIAPSGGFSSGSGVSPGTTRGGFGSSGRSFGGFSGS